MRTLKIIWYSLVAAFLLAGLLTGRREFFLLMFIMGFVSLYSLALNLWTVFSFSYTQKLDKEVCVKGGQTFLRVKIYNEKPFPFPFIRLEVRPVVRSKRQQFDFSLLPHSHVDFAVPLPCPYRGVFGVGMTSLTVNDSFGLVRTRFNMFRLPYYRQSELKVYPRLTELSVLPARRRDNKNFGNALLQDREHGESYSGLRKFRPGDAFKRVHRTASARRRELLVKTYEAPFETSVFIILDTAIGKQTEEDGLYLADLACECAAAIANYSLRAGHRVIFSCPAFDSVTAFESIRKFPRFYDILAELQFSEQCDFPQVSTDGTQAAYVISARAGEFAKAFSKADMSNIKLISVSVNKGTDTEQAGLPSGVWSVQISVGDDIAAVLGREAVQP